MARRRAPSLCFTTTDQFSSPSFFLARRYRRRALPTPLFCLPPLNLVLARADLAHARSNCSPGTATTPPGTIPRLEGPVQCRIYAEFAVAARHQPLLADDQGVLALAAHGVAAMISGWIASRFGLIPRTMSVRWQAAIFCDPQPKRTQHVIFHALDPGRCPYRVFIPCGSAAPSLAR